MKILQIGAGSMGTRRIRDIVERTDVDLAVFDQREDRRLRVEKQFGVATFPDKTTAFSWNPEVLIISTPPDRHNEYIKIALEKGLHHFCEENIWTYDYKHVERISIEKSLVSAPSCSFHFLPMIQKIREILNDGKIGNIHSYQMTLSTYMPSWHPEEGSEYYARNRNTAAGREMVPFELVWLNHTFGAAEFINGMIGRFGSLSDEFEDSWSLQMQLKSGGIGTLTVLHGAVPIVRQGLCICEHGTINFNLMSGELFVSIEGSKEQRILCGSSSEVLESLYYDEINTFIDT
ncbi:MAG: Gfo/Idh/MocA family oxidoreductase, partial [Spirochaetaceae bacterium]|nr:Gfo/Idh/MocA family oxidoreductase [Spirochaetaceae bacterium]